MKLDDVIGAKIETKKIKVEKSSKTEEDKKEEKMEKNLEKKKKKRMKVKMTKRVEKKRTTMKKINILNTYYFRLNETSYKSYN